jgi:hypothetical protein
VQVPVVFDRTMYEIRILKRASEVTQCRIPPYLCCGHGRCRRQSSDNGQDSRIVAQGWVAREGRRVVPPHCVCLTCCPIPACWRTLILASPSPASFSPAVSSPLAQQKPQAEVTAQCSVRCARRMLDLLCSCRLFLQDAECCVLPSLPSYVG